MPEDLRDRSPEEIFDDHLQLAGEHRFDEDIERNVAPELREWTAETAATR